ncbi:MAG TPA: DUF3309 family protein [Usitatibacter sp.]|nr:DUF3309 family protein [Usitatibacter sp.]
MNLLLWIVVILVVLSIAGAPQWGYHSYGYRPSIGLGGILLIVLVLWALGFFR